MNMAKHKVKQRRMTAISARLTPEDIQLLGQLAKAKKKFAGDLVASAVLQVYGDEMRALKASLKKFESNVHFVEQ